MNIHPKVTQEMTFMWPTYMNRVRDVHAMRLGYFHRLQFEICLQSETSPQADRVRLATHARIKLLHVLCRSLSRPTLAVPHSNMHVPSSAPG